MPIAKSAPKPKYREILDRLLRDIQTGRYKPGQRFPSEAALVKRFAASRITVGRAVRELQQLGFVDRVAGSGTFVRSHTRQSRDSLLFGLIIPDLGETEIFEPICQGIAQSREASNHALLWAHSDASVTSRVTQVVELCRQCIARSVSGVFFAPLELDPGALDVNRRVLRLLRHARIPVVLLDHRPEDTSVRERCDLVGIDNHRAGFIATNHLANLGAKRIAFASFQHQASTVERRIGGYRDALATRSLRSAGEFVLRHTAGDALDIAWRPGRFDAVVCANDKVAGGVMHALLQRGAAIPKDVRIVGIDDVAYASLLPIPLTTVRQPCLDIGDAALHVMLERLDRPNMPARNVFLDCSLVVRESCGAKSHPRP